MSDATTPLETATDYARLFEGIDKRLDELDVGQVKTFRFHDHAIVVIVTNQVAIHSGRRRFCVGCTSCDALLHEATTGPAERIRSHIERVARKP